MPSFFAFVTLLGAALEGEESSGCKRTRKRRGRTGEVTVLGEW
jgi:hypothetical protein